MKNIFVFVSILLSLNMYAQSKKPKIMGWYTTLDAQIGYDLGNIITTLAKDPDDVYHAYEEPEFGHFMYGFNAQLGFHPIERFSLSAGVRYNYITPNFHLINSNFQGNYYFNLNETEDFSYFFLRGGAQLNTSATNDAQFVGFGYGKVEPIGRHYGHQFQVFLELHKHNDNTPFIGLSYGLVLFQKKL